MKQDMNRLGEDYEHSMARFLQLKRNSEESVTQVRGMPGRGGGGDGAGGGYVCGLHAGSKLGRE